MSRLMPVERAVLAVAGVSLLAGVIGWVGGSTPEEPLRPFVANAVEKGYMPCPTEDYALTPCYWDARTMGNGQGRSYLWTGDETFYEEVE